MNPVEKKKFEINVDLWRWIAIISGAFAFLVCFLLIANYIQINRLDPVNTEAVNTLVVRLSENPSDEALRNEIRALDLLVRRAYFTNQWQVRTGGYMALISLALMLISFQIIKSTKPLNPIINDENKASDQMFNKLSRKWIAIGGSSIVLIALILTFLTHERLENTFYEAAVAAAANETEVVKDKSVQKVSKGVKVDQADVVEKKEDLEENKVADKNLVEKKVGEAPKKETETKKVEESAVESKVETPVVAAAVAEAEVSTFTSNARKNFPSFRGVDGLGIAYQKNIPSKWDGESNQNILWKSKINIESYNSPIVWGDKVFLTGANADGKEVYCYHKNTGDLLWTATVGDIPNSPASPDVSHDTGHAAATAATDGKRVYAIFSNGDIIAIDMEGAQVWARNLGLPQNHYGHSSSLIVYEDKIIVQYDHGKSAKVMALSTETGAEIWNTPRKVRISWASPVIVQRETHTEVVLIADPNIAAYDINTGKELWLIDCIYGEVGPSIAYADGIVYGLNEYASLVAISGGNEPKVLWEDFDYLSDVPSPIATKDLLFVVTSYGVMVCHNAKTGEKYWEKEFDNGFYASPILVEGKIYLMDREGIMHIIKAQNTFELVGESALGVATDSSPAFADGQIFIRAGGNLYCIGTAN